MEVAEVVAWGQPVHKLADDEDDDGLDINARFTMTNGLVVPAFSYKTPHIGADVWTDQALIHWEWEESVKVYSGYDETGCRIPLDRPFTQAPYPEFWYLGSSINSFLDSVRTGSKLWISGHDLRQALEIAIAAKRSAACGSVPIKLPLADRNLTLKPSPFRWNGGDTTGRYQSAKESKTPWTGYVGDAVPWVGYK